MADVFAIPGHVGLGLNQAFYFGLPVVTEEGKHPPEIAYLKPGRNGFMVPENDLAALRPGSLNCWTTTRSAPNSPATPVTTSFPRLRPRGCTKAFVIAWSFCGGPARQAGQTP